MKIRLYMDIYPGMEAKYANASATAYNKPSSNITRYSIDLEIPDPNRPDAVAEVVRVEDVTEHFKAKHPTTDEIRKKALQHKGKQ